MSNFESFKVRKGIIDSMLESDLDPGEFMSFMKKYAEFISLGITNSKMLAAENPALDNMSNYAALTKGAECFRAFIEGFGDEYKAKQLERPSKAKK
jgi:hypothetical protein